MPLLKSFLGVGQLAPIGGSHSAPIGGSACRQLTGNIYTVDFMIAGNGNITVLSKEIEDEYYRVDLFNAEHIEKYSVSIPTIKDQNGKTNSKEQLRNIDLKRSARLSDSFVPPF